MEASGISALSIRHPIATSLVMVGILFVGIVAYPLLPVAPLPQVDFPTIQVTASYPGASPETMASSVAQPLERQFSQIPDVSEMTSSSALGTTRVTLQFNLDRDIDAAANDVQAAINAAGGQLPANLPAPPTYRKSNPADAPIMILAVSSKAVPLTDVDDAADTKLAQRISQVQGVAQVLIGGEQKPAVRLQIDPAKLVAKGLSLEDVRNAASVITVNSPKGTIDGKTQSFTIYANDQLTAAKDWNESIVAYRNGAPLRIKDIGQAVTGPEDTKQAAWADGQRGVFLMVFKQPGANVIQIVDKIKSQLPQLQASIPQTIDVSIVSDRTTTIRASIEDVQATLLLTIVLVVLVIFVFLRSPWATIIPSVTVPLALLGACGLMWIAGYSLDNLSLMALTISVGFVVDDAIVMLENITRHIEEGEKPYEAALKGSSEIGFTIVAISVSLVAVLIPLLLMSGIIGRLFREFAVTLTMAIGVSALVSLTLTPTLCALFLKSEKETKHGRIYQWSERAFDGMLKGYERGLDFVLARRLTTLIVFIVTVALTGLLYVWIPKGFFPEQDTGLISGQSEAAEDVSFAEMIRRQEALGDIVQQDPAVASIVMSLGGSKSGSALNAGRVFITLKPLSERDASAQQVIARLRPKLDQVQGAKLFLQAQQDVRMGGRPSRTEYQFAIQDPDIDELNEWSPRILATLQKMPQLQDVASDQQTNGSTLTLSINRDKAARYGIQPQLIDDTLYDAFGQRFIAQYFTQLNSYHVVLEILPALQGDVGSLDKIFIHSPSTGGEVPLSTFAQWTTKPVRASDDQPPGPVPGDDDQLQPGARRVARRCDQVRAGRARRAQAAGGDADELPGHRAGVPGIADLGAAADSRGAGRGLSDPRRALRKLRPSADDPVDAAVGGARRARDPDAVRIRLQPDRADRHHSADRHRQEERHHDGRLRHRRRARRQPAAGEGDPPGGAAALSPDHDDHDGGDPRRRAADARRRHRRGNPPAARLFHRRRPDRQPGADAVHHAGDLSLS